MPCYHPKKGDYLLTVKDNQKHLKAAIEQAFALTETPPRTFQETDSGHGRVEERTMEVLTVPLNAVHWPGLRQWCRITRTRETRGRKSTEISYAITSLGETRATPKQLLALNRNHWSIENNLHWVKDNVLREDRSTLRTKNTPQAIAALRNMALFLIKKAGLTPTIARETFAENKNNAIKQMYSR